MRSAAIASSASAARRASPRREAEALGVAHCADVDAEALAHAGRVAERELGAATAGVEHHDRAVDGAEAGPDAR